MIEKGSLIETRRGMFRVIDTRTLFNPFTENDETEYIIDDNGVKRKVYASDVIAEVQGPGMQEFKGFEFTGEHQIHVSPEDCNSGPLYSTVPGKFA